MYQVPGTVFWMTGFLNIPPLTLEILILIWKTPCGISRAIRLIVGYRNNRNNRPLWRWDIARLQEGPGRILKYWSGFRNNISRILYSSGDKTKKTKTTHTSHTRSDTKSTHAAYASHTHSNSKSAAGVDHDEFIVIGGDESAKYDNSSDGGEDVGAGAGAGDEVIKL